jgi:hypothetical protein
MDLALVLGGPIEAAEPQGKKGFATAITCSTRCNTANARDPIVPAPAATVPYGRQSRSAAYEDRV